MNFIFAAKITGIVLIILYTIGGFYVLIDDKKVMPWYKVLLGMVFINLINGLLVYGAIKRNGSFLTLWIVLSIIVIISFIIESIIGKEINYSTICIIYPHCLGMNYYANVLGGVGSNGLYIK